MYTMLMSLQENEPAPSWEAKDQDGNIHSSSDYKGKWLILYFYPKDDSPGCTKEACTIRDSFKELSQKAEILGVSADSVDSHRKFREKYSLPFNLLADPDKKMINAFGADGLILNKRVTFIIDPKGTIVKIFNSVSPEKHAQQLVVVMDSLQN